MLTFTLYAPNNARDRKSIRNLKDNVSVVNGTIEFIVMGGDYNCVLESKLDRKNCINTRQDQNQELSQIIENLNLVDLWRKHFPHKR